MRSNHGRCNGYGKNAPGKEAGRRPCAPVAWPERVTSHQPALRLPHPFDAMANEPAKSVQLEEALTFARSLPRKNQFSHMSDAEIKRSKLAAKGFVPSNGGEY